MKLHIFNPEHDIALAKNLANFTAPHAGRQLRSDLSWLPAVWAEEGDGVLVDNVEYAERQWSKCHFRFVSHSETTCRHKNNLFITLKQFFSDSETTAIIPWGWDKALCVDLMKHGVNASLLPSQVQLEDIRRLSHRRIAAQLLPLLRCEGTVGEAFECTSVEQVGELMERYGRIVLKAPWSSSGRGIRFLSVDSPSSTVQQWLCNLIAAQGSVMVEPYYNKVKDFGMEFEALANGEIHYLGLSLFHTANGAYTGNILATERAKREVISHYLPLSLLYYIQAEICRRLADVLMGKYIGPFGVDMMAVEATQSFLLHPCVEINLRRTMGHVALSLMPTDDDVQWVMRIEYNGQNYKLKLNKL